MIIELPYPDKLLNPNRSKSLHWGKKSSLTKTAKNLAYTLTRLAMGRDTFTGPLMVLVTFYPPNRNKRDKDNAIASIKAAQDGVAMALKVDDADWNVHYQLSKDPLNKVVFEVTQGRVLEPFKVEE